MFRYQGTTQGSVPQAAIPGRQHPTGGYLILLFSLTFMLSSLLPTRISQATCCSLGTELGPAGQEV